MSSRLVYRLQGTLPANLRSSEGLASYGMVLSGFLGFAAAEALCAYPSRVSPLRACITGLDWEARAVTEQVVGNKKTTVVLHCPEEVSYKNPWDFLAGFASASTLFDSIHSPRFASEGLNFNIKYSQAQIQVARFCSERLLESSALALAGVLGANPDGLKLSVLMQYHTCRRELHLA